MVYAADTLRDSIESAWGLTGRLNNSVTPEMKEIVYFYAYPEIMGNEVSKAIEVKKINELEDEQVTEHPNFSEVSDIFEIRCRYRMADVQLVSRDEAEADMEDLCKEVVRILKTLYAPQAGTGPYYTTRRAWTRQDDYRTEQPELIRALRFTLTYIKSASTEVFNGYSGVLTFDTSATTGADSKPGSDYAYTEVTAVTISEGTNVTSRMTRLSSAKTGKPIKFRGKFRGTFTATLFAKKSDLNGSTIEALDNIYIAQNNGELATAVFLHATDNTEGTPITMTTSTPMMIINIRKTSDDESLVSYEITGDITAPTTVSGV